MQINDSWTPKSLCFYARYDAEKSARFVEQVAEIASELSLCFSLDFATKDFFKIEL